MPARWMAHGARATPRRGGAIGVQRMLKQIARTLLQDVRHTRADDNPRPAVRGMGCGAVHILYTEAVRPDPCRVPAHGACVADAAAWRADSSTKITFVQQPHDTKGSKWLVCLFARVLRCSSSEHTRTRQVRQDSFKFQAKSDKLFSRQYRWKTGTHGTLGATKTFALDGHGALR